MKDDLLEKIDNPAVRNEMSRLLNNGVDFKENDLDSFVSDGLNSDLLQVFPTMETDRILDHLKMEDITSAGDIFMAIRAHEGLYWKVTEIVRSISEDTDAKLVWNFQPSREVGNVMKIVTLYR